MSYRLNKTKKLEIIKKVVNAKLQKKLDKEIDKLTVIADKAASSYYSPEVKEWMNNKPKDAANFVTKNKVFLFVSEDRRFQHKLMTGSFTNTCRYRCSTSLSNSVEFRYIDALNGVEVIVPKPLIKKLNIIEKNLDNLRKEHTELVKYLNVVLASCTTSKKLKENYPALIKYLPKEPSKKNKSLQITNADLKKLIG